MKKRTKNVLFLGALVITLSQPTVTFADGIDHSSDNTGTYLTVGGLCMGGAIVGSVIPIFGNIAGCAIGAVAGWFWSSDNDPDPEVTQPNRVVLDR